MNTSIISFPDNNEIDVALILQAEVDDLVNLFFVSKERYVKLLNDKLVLSQLRQKYKLKVNFASFAEFVVGYDKTKITKRSFRYQTLIDCTSKAAAKGDLPVFYHYFGKYKKDRAPRTHLLLHAFRSANIEIINHLFDDNGVTIDGHYQKLRERLLESAAASGNIELINAVIEWGHFFDHPCPFRLNRISSLFPFEHRENALSLAVAAAYRKRHTQAVEFLRSTGGTGKYAVHIAAKRGDVHFINSVLRECKPCDVYDELVYAFGVAIEFNQQSVIDIILSTVGTGRTNESSFGMMDATMRFNRQDLLDPILKEVDRSHSSWYRYIGKHNRLDLIPPLIELSDSSNWSNLLHGLLDGKHNKPAMEMMHLKPFKRKSVAVSIVRHNNINLIKTLQESSDHKVKFNLKFQQELLNTSARFGNLEIFELMTSITPYCDCDEAMMECIGSSGNRKWFSDFSFIDHRHSPYPKIAKTLLPFVTLPISMFVSGAIRQNNSAILEFFIEDTTVDWHSVMIEAMLHSLDCAELILQHNKVDPVRCESPHHINGRIKRLIQSYIK